MTFASGGLFSKYSHEFQTVCDAGEDVIYVDEDTKMAVNKEVYDDPEVYNGNDLKKESLIERTSVEVGNIFTLGTRFSEPLGLTYKDREGNAIPVVMGSYGIGPGRLMGTIVEVLSDQKGIVWPKEVAPYPVHLITITGGNGEVAAEADRLYELLKENRIEALYDDRDARAGEKFADADLIGIPTRVVVSEKTMQQGGVEISSRIGGSTSIIAESKIIEHLKV
jgi:prolyl-tRNA synthetase